MLWRIIFLLLISCGSVQAALPSVVWCIGKTYQSCNKTEGTIIQCNVRLTYPNAADTTCMITCTGANLTTYGMGRDLIASETTITIPAGKLVPNIQPTITVANNPLYFPDRIVVLTLTGPSNNAKTNPYNRIYINLHDDACPNVIDVTNPGHELDACIGDGITEDGPAFQAILNYLKDNSGGVAYIPENKTILVTPYQMVGSIKVGTKLPCKQKITIAGPYPRTAKIICGVYDNGFHWLDAHFLDIGTASYGWSNVASDSPGLCFLNVTLDGNGPNQSGWGSWTREQCFALVIAANDNDGNNQGRIKVILDGCKIQNTLSDGISICRNTNLRLYNTDGLNCTRGVVTGLGGYCLVDLRNVNCLSDGSCFANETINDMSLHLEQTAGENGYNNSADEQWILNNVYCQKDIGWYPSDSLGNPVVPSSLTATNFTQDSYGWWSLYSISSDITISGYSSLLNCVKSINSNYTTGLLYGIGGMVNISGTTFIYGHVQGQTFYDTAATSPGIYHWSPCTIQISDGGDITLESCTFTAVNDYPNPPLQGPSGLILPVGVAIIPDVNGLTERVPVTLSDCTYSGKFYNNIYIGSDSYANVTIDGGTFTASAGDSDYSNYGNHFYIVWTGNKPSNVTIKNINISSGKFLFIYGTPTASVNLDVSDDVIISKEANVIQTLWSSRTLDNVTIVGGRTIIAPEGDNTPPDGNTNGFINDIYKLNNGNGDTYICDQAGWLTYTGISKNYTTLTSHWTKQ